MALSVKSQLPEKLLRPKLRGCLLAMWRKMLLNLDINLKHGPKIACAAALQYLTFDTCTCSATCCAVSYAVLFLSHTAYLRGSCLFH